MKASTELVNEKLTFCMHFPIPTRELDALHGALQDWRIRCPGSAAMGLANVATGRLDGCLEQTGLHQSFKCNGWRETA